VQAAERALREELGLDAIADVRLVRALRRGHTAEVTFATPRGRIRVTLERSLGAPLRLTCHATDEVQPPVWRTIAIERAVDAASG
jgi:hypothetical protein